jgi:hypothetical protein
MGHIQESEGIMQQHFDEEMAFWKKEEPESGV